MVTKFKYFSMFVILSLLLTACSISITTKVNGDGTGEMGFAYKFTKDDLSQLGTYGMNADTICTDLQSQSGGSSGVPSDFTLKQETHGAETWCVASKQFTSLDTLKTEISGSGFTINTMDISGGKFTFDGTADMTSSDTGSMPLSITILYELTAPGTIDKAKSDADSYNGNTATWNLALGQTKSLHLESNTKGGGGGGGGINLGGGSKTVKVGGTNVSYLAIAVACCCCLLLVVIIVVVIFFVMRRRKPKQPGM